MTGSWGAYNITDSIKAIGADPAKYSVTVTDKKLFVNADGTKQIVYDIKTGYYRAQDLAHPNPASQLSYLDPWDNKIRENVPVYNKQTGKWTETGLGKDVRKALTHFNNSGPYF